MSIPDTYLDVRPALGGYQVIYVQPDRQRQVIIESPRDVAAVASLFLLPVLSLDIDVRLACRSAGVRVVERNEELWR